jgi:flagella basal body P-ring formation protein FlgA
MPGTVLIEGEACALLEVAEIKGPRELTKRVGALLLTVKDGVITRDQVIAAVRVSGLEDVRVEIRMPEAVKVEKKGLLKSDEAGEPREHLIELIKTLSLWQGEVDVQWQGTVPGGRLVAPASIVPGTAAVTLKFRDSSGRDRSLAVRMTWTQPVLVLTRSVQKGEILRESDVTTRQVRVNKPGIYASMVSEVVGQSARKNLSQGEPLTFNVLNSPGDAPRIEKGKSVVIIVRSGGLMVKAKGEALEKGAPGETIRVRNTASKAVLTAVVLTEDTVEVKMP